MESLESLYPLTLLGITDQPGPSGYFKYCGSLGLGVQLACTIAHTFCKLYIPYNYFIT